MAAKITNFFERMDEPLPIRWTPSAEPPSKKRKRGPGRPRKVQPPTQRVIDSDSEQSDKENADTGLEGEAKKTKRIYGIQQKRRIVAYATKNSVTEAHEYFNVPRTTINRWMKDGYFERETTKKGTKKGAGRPIVYGVEIDEQLLTWLLDARDKQLPVTTPLLRAKALELITPTHPKFKASDGWVQKFKQRHSLVLRMKTSLAQELPATLEERIMAFRSQLQRLKEINKFEVIGNMDETPLYFDVVPNRILDKRGRKVSLYEPLDHKRDI